jgi:hypothetical protein
MPMADAGRTFMGPLHGHSARKPQPSIYEVVCARLPFVL